MSASIRQELHRVGVAASKGAIQENGCQHLVRKVKRLEMEIAMTRAERDVLLKIVMYSAKDRD